MSQGNHKPSLTDVAEQRKRDIVNYKRTFHTELGDVLTALEDADRPLSTADLKQLTHNEKDGVHRRLNRLLEAGKIEKRTDGPDGRVVYYQPKGMDFDWGNDES